MNTKEINQAIKELKLNGKSCNTPLSRLQNEIDIKKLEIEKNNLELKELENDYKRWASIK